MRRLTYWFAEYLWKRFVQEVRRLINQGELPADRGEEFIASITLEESTTWTTSASPPWALPQ